MCTYVWRNVTFGSLTYMCLSRFKSGDMLVRKWSNGSYFLLRRKRNGLLTVQFSRQFGDFLANKVYNCHFTTQSQSLFTQLSWNLMLTQSSKVNAYSNCTCNCQKLKAAKIFSWINKLVPLMLKCSLLAKKEKVHLPSCKKT